MQFSLLESQVKTNLDRVLDNITRAAQSAGRDPETVRLVVVTKGHPLERVQAALAAGAHYLGENYVDEALEKIVSLGSQTGVEWHMIGHIQSRKARLVSENFAYVHSLDSLKLAERLDRFAGEAGKRLPVLLECNVSGEESKYGFPAWELEQWQTLAEQAERIAELDYLEPCGLMTMPPYFDEPEVARPYFQKLARLRDFLHGRVPGINWIELSMGMSGDYEVAIQEGATWVRIGQAILGPRPE
jgi:PLP dependent protein